MAGYLEISTVIFQPVTMYSKRPKLRNAYQQAVASYSYIPVDAAFAVIVNGPHTSRSDAVDHITVDFYNHANEYINRAHVDPPAV